jgi:hypothetical protein
VFDEGPFAKRRREEKRERRIGETPVEIGEISLVM